MLLTVFVRTYSYTVYLSAEMWSSSFIVALLAPLLSLSKVPNKLEKMVSSTSLTTTSSSPPPASQSPSNQESINSSEESESLLTADETQALVEFTGMRRRTAGSTTY